TAEAVRHFRKASRAETQAALAMAEERQAALQGAWLATEEERAKLQTILASLPGGVWVVDARGAVTSLNREAPRRECVGEDEVCGQFPTPGPGPQEGISRPDGTACGPTATPIARALRGAVVAHEEVAWPLHGVERTVSINAAPLTDSVGTIR